MVAPGAATWAATSTAYTSPANTVAEATMATMRKTRFMDFLLVSKVRRGRPLECDMAYTPTLKGSTYTPERVGLSTCGRLLVMGDGALQVEEHPRAAEGLPERRLLHDVQHFRVERREPQRHALAAHLLFRFDQHLQRGVLDVDQGAAVEDDDGGLSRGHQVR